MSDKQKSKMKTIKGPARKQTSVNKIWVSLKSLGPIIDNNYKTDPRFKDRSEYLRHVLNLGLLKDKKAREEALSKIKV